MNSLESALARPRQRSAYEPESDLASLAADYGFGLAPVLPTSLLGPRAFMSIPNVPVVPLPPITIMVALGVVPVATVAAWIPARRAASVNPAVRLRSE